GCADIASRPLEQICEFPGLDVRSVEHANVPWSRGVAGACAEDAEPAILEANQIGERVVRRLVPNLAHRLDQLDFGNIAWQKCDRKNKDLVHGKFSILSSASSWLARQSQPWRKTLL